MKVPTWLYPGHMQRPRPNSRAVWQGLTAFAVTAFSIVVSGCDLISASSQMSRPGTDPELKQAPLYPAPWLELSYAEGFNQRYVQWIAEFQTLQELLDRFNQLPGLKQPVLLQLQSCSDDPRLENADALSLPRHSPRQVQFCYELLAYLNDQFDDLSASPRERQVAVLDALYFLVVRQLSQIVIDDYNLLSTADNLDRVTVVLPQLLQHQSSDTVLSGIQWIFNQGYPLGVETGVAQFMNASVLSVTKPLTLDTYRRVICQAYGLAPDLYPYLTNEIPAELSLETCQPEASEALRQWQEQLKAESR